MGDLALKFTIMGSSRAREAVNQGLPGVIAGASPRPRARADTAPDSQTTRARELTLDRVISGIGKLTANNELW